MKSNIKTLCIVMLVACIATPNLMAQDGLTNDLSVHSSALKNGLKISENLTDFEPNNSLKIKKANSDLDDPSVRFRGRDLWERSFDLDRYYPRRGTDNFVNIYLGLNNWLEDGDLPNSDESYSLIPLNSWYFGINFDNITHLLGPLYLDWGLGLSFQDYAFENTRTRLIKTEDAIQFQEEAGITGRKSKVNVGYLNVHFVPTFAVGRNRDFRVGFGVYGGYRISSNTKMKFDDSSGSKQKDKIKDSYHINPFKYGFRATVGWESFDMFFNYDLTEFFDEDINAPRLSPVTFGIIF